MCDACHQELVCGTAHACLHTCGFTFTTSSPHVHAPPLLPFAPPPTGSALRYRRACEGGFPLLQRYIPQSPTSDLIAAPTIGALQHRLYLFACTLQPATCSEKTSHPAAHPHNTRQGLHATTLHSHLLPAHTPAPHSHLCFGYKQPAGAHTWADPNRH